MLLGPVEARVIGSLIEKELTTPQQYPLTLNALVAACNQNSNREPVVVYQDETVQAACAWLKEHKLVRFVHPSHGRSAIRFRHVIDEELQLDDRQRALLAVRLLRGQQTIGELRARSERMAAFDALRDVEHELEGLAARSEPLAARVRRQPGQKEDRFWSPLMGDPDLAPQDDGVFQAPRNAPEHQTAELDGGAPISPRREGVGESPADLEDRRAEVQLVRAEVEHLRAEVEDLRAEVEELRSGLGELRDSLGG
jgi:uncharacterized protein YceH (UPF0502 family)